MQSDCVEAFDTVLLLFPVFRPAWASGMLTNYCCVIALQILIEHIDFIRSEKARRRFVSALSC
jgi:hypothetical protein